MQLFWAQNYVGGEEDTLAKSAAVIRLLRGDADVDIVAPTPVSVDELELAHSPGYVDDVLHGRVGAGVSVTDKSLMSVLSSTGGVVSAASDAVNYLRNSGSASSGLHHARRGAGYGFCTFNGLAVAARSIGLEWAAAGEDEPRIHIVDLDAHCGGGTWDILRGDENVSATDVSVDHYDEYEPDRTDWSLSLVKRPGRYLWTIQSALPDSAFDLVLYNAGMDPWEGSAIGGMLGITADMLAERDAMVFEWARSHGSPVAFVFAGGYGDLGQIAALHAQTVRLAAKA
jgi:acetoin utilization deacetylase AcuC-like enzyme